MPAKPLYDLASIDCDADTVTREERLACLSQRGSFEMLTGIAHRDIEAGIIVGYKDIRGDDWWAADHIPGRPLFPGALMIEAAAQLCSYDYYHHELGDPDKFVGFGGVNQTRFRGTVEPEGRLYLIGKVNRIRKSMFTYFAQGFYRDRLVFETEIIGVVL